MDSKFLDQLSLDPNIKRAVYALNNCDVVTSMSCEGHTDHGRSYPWITCKQKMTKYGKAEIEELYVRIPELEKAVELKYGRSIHMSWFNKIDDDPLIDKLIDLWDKRNAYDKFDKFHYNKCFKFVIDLLVEFYDTCGVTNYKTMLSVSGEDDYIRIQPHLGKYTNNTTEDIEAYQAEMNRFAAYLEKKIST